MTNRDEQPLRTDPAEYAAAEFELQSTGQADYGNCVPSRLMRVLFILCGVLLLVFALLLIVWAHASALIVVGLLCALVIAFTVYMELCRRLFAFDGGGLMGAMHQMVVDNLDWDGRGRLLDIGCGAAALTARCAMTFPDGEFTGIDDWGATRSRAKEQCEANARAEGITAPMSFVEGAAAHLDFPDGSFDAAVSNFVFHEVRSEPDKRALVREALRVDGLRPGAPRRGRLRHRVHPPHREPRRRPLLGQDAVDDPQRRNPPRPSLSPRGRRSGSNPVARDSGRGGTSAQPRLE